MKHNIRYVVMSFNLIKANIFTMELFIKKEYKNGTFSRFCNEKVDVLYVKIERFLILLETILFFGKIYDIMLVLVGKHSMYFCYFYNITNIMLLGPFYRKFREAGSKSHRKNSKVIKCGLKAYILFGKFISGS